MECHAQSVAPIFVSTPAPEAEAEAEAEANATELDEDSEMAEHVEEAVVSSCVSRRWRAGVLARFDDDHGEEIPTEHGGFFFPVATSRDDSCMGWLDQQILAIERLQKELDHPRVTHSISSGRLGA